MLRSFWREELSRLKNPSEEIMWNKNIDRSFVLMSFLLVFAAFAISANAQSTGNLPKICVATTRSNLTDTGVGFRKAFVQYLSGPAAEIIELESMVSVQQTAEAKQKGCDYIFSTTVTQEKKGGGGGLGKAFKTASSAASIASDAGYQTGASSTVSNAGWHTSNGLYKAGDLAQGVKAKSEVTMTYDLVKVGVKESTVNGKLSAKAKKDNEDIITPMIEKAVNAVLEATL